jgi:hypothetical protein
VTATAGTRKARPGRRIAQAAFGCTLALVGATITATSTYAAPSAVAYRIPGTNVVCSGGDVSAPTLGARKAADDPAGWASASATERDLLNHTYSGTTCRSAWSRVIGLLPPLVTALGPRLDPLLVPAAQPSDPMNCWSPSDFPASYKNCNTTGTAQFGECPPTPGLGTLDHPGCLTMYTEMDSTLYPDDHYKFDGIEQLEADIYLPNDTGVWTPNAAVLNDNHGNHATSLVQDPFYTFNYGNHRGYGTTIHGSMDYRFFKAPKKIGLQDMLEAVAGWGELFTERVHLAYQATLHQDCPCGTAADESFCLFSDWAANDTLLQVDRCVNP